ncbi:MAG: hypothetical protein AAFQ23_05745, partial [Cyanobacteria bacterium J06623_1]
FEAVGIDAIADELLSIQRRVICNLRERLDNLETQMSDQEYLSNGTENSWRDRSGFQRSYLSNTRLHYLCWEKIAE